MLIGIVVKKSIMVGLHYLCRGAGHVCYSFGRCFRAVVVPSGFNTLTTILGMVPMAIGERGRF